MTGAAPEIDEPVDQQPLQLITDILDRQISVVHEGLIRARTTDPTQGS